MLPLLLYLSTIEERQITPVDPAKGGFDGHLQPRKKKKVAIKGANAI